MSTWVSPYHPAPRMETQYSRVCARCVCGTEVFYDSSKAAAPPHCPHCGNGNTRLTVVATTAVYENGS